MISNERIEAGEPDGARSISLDDRLREVEAGPMSWALTLSHGNRSKVAKLLQVKRSTQGDRINRCELGRADNHVTAAAIPQQREAVRRSSP
jgi:DNA-binding NtrC family response regulator